MSQKTKRHENFARRQRNQVPDGKAIFGCLFWMSWAVSHRRNIQKKEANPVKPVNFFLKVFFHYWKFVLCIFKSFSIFLICYFALFIISCIKGNLFASFFIKVIFLCLCNKCLVFFSNFT